eukprot:Phypoly_transcript_07398.p1 GENE.Phypoly_transcript_07398~~Phypoly_transcript_07398.p1  ORF type:complete len:486 (+),score=52.59 Phypoly_transcript_07398:99-1556(+)
MKWVIVVLGLICGALASFPDGFMFGTATAAYQVEGAWNISRGLSIWDVFSHTPGKTTDGMTGDVADDHYHRFAEDIALMKELGLKNYRLSLSWSRIFLTGLPPSNPDGIRHYSEVINTLLANGIEPFVTLYHWDLPVGLPGTWLNESIVNAFATYADTVFAAFGDRVKHWITFNEPLSFTVQGYAGPGSAPGRCSDRSVCPEGNSSTEPYIAAHNVLLSHAAAVAVYKQKYQKQQGGIIGITLNCDWAEPLTSSASDQAAAQRHLEFQLAWYADPIFFGDYPQVMKDLVGDRLPQFTDAQKDLLKGSWDYFGLNHYTSGYNSNNPVQNPADGWSGDQMVTTSPYRNGTLIGPQAASNWLYVVPWGINSMLHWVSDRYGNPPIIITENGCDVPNETSIPLPQVLNDQFRIDYYSQYLSNVSLAIDQGVDVQGYFAWSFMDNYEWSSGYTLRFGLHYVDYANNLTRYTKDSALWFSKYIQSQTKVSL